MIANGLRGFGRMPDPIANAPDLWPWLHPYYMAFETLSPERPKDRMAGTVEIIPWSVIDRYCQRNPWLGLDFDTTLLYIRTLDFRYVEWVRNLKKDSGSSTDEEGNPKPKKKVSRTRG